MKYKIILNKKYSLNHPYFRNSKKENLSALLDQYNGFEGECFYYYQNKDLEELDNIINICNKLMKQEQNPKLLLLCLSIPKIENRKTLEKIAFFLGYDYGILLNEDDIYSSILQEVLFGHIEELQLFKEQLNKNYLFPTYEKAKEYAKKHNQLLLEGKDVEIEDDMQIYEIWEIKL